MRSKLLGTAVGFVVCGALSLTGTASAGSRADTTVTIQEQSGDFSGQVKSPHPMRCAEGRKVVLFKQKGQEQRPRNDERIASDTASLNGDRYEWSTGNTGLHNGRFYARAPKTSDCQADNSRTVRAT
jgi:hypothetical protein